MPARRPVNVRMLLLAARRRRSGDRGDDVRAGSAASPAVAAVRAVSRCFAVQFATIPRRRNLEGQRPFGNGGR